jgi:hypothetical protein
VQCSIFGDSLLAASCPYISGWVAVCMRFACKYLGRQAVSGNELMNGQKAVLTQQSRSLSLRVLVKFSGSYSFLCVLCHWPFGEIWMSVLL